VIARFGLLKARSGLSAERFSEHWLKSHGPLAAQFPGLQRYYQHLVTNKEQFGIDHKRGMADLDGFSELHFESQDVMHRAIKSQSFAGALSDEEAFLDEVKIVVCEKHPVVPVNLGDGPYIKRMTLLKRLPGISAADFKREWLVTHAQWVRQWPNVLGYTQNLVVDRFHKSRTDSAEYDEVPVDGIVEFWFRNEAEAKDIYASDIVTKTQQHALIFLDEITPFFVKTSQIV
jgi:uncharacterized protein (TIGR02118 family)